MSKSRHLMKTVFGLDNGFMRAAERVFDLVLLNLLTVLTSLPLVTAGLARLALYRTLVDLRERGRLPILATYWHYLTANWRQGLVLGTVEVAVTGFTLFDLYLIRGQEGLPFQVLTVMAYAVLFLNVVTHLYIYPLAGKYQLSLQELYIRSLLVAGLNAPWTILFLLVLGVLFLALSSSLLALLLGLSVFLVIGMAGLTYAYMLVVERLLDR